MSDEIHSNDGTSGEKLTDVRNGNLWWCVPQQMWISKGEYEEIDAWIQKELRDSQYQG